MKPGTITKTNFQTMHVANSWDSLKSSNSDNPFSFQDFSEPLPMNYKELEPPAHIWDRIAKVLDEQDRVKAIPDVHTAFAPTAATKRANNKRAILFAAAITIVAVIILAIV